MADDDRLNELMTQLATHWERHPARRRPPRISVEDGVAIARELHKETDAGTTARAQHARENGLELACAPGCSYCCENIVFVFEAEALAVSRWLEQPENKDAKAWFLSTYAAWRQAVGDVPQRAAAARESNRAEVYAATVREVWEQRVMCAFNRDGACTIYPVRPNHCRTCHALDTPDRCVSTSHEPPRALAFPALEAFLQTSHSLVDATHVALGKRRGIPTPLCETVYRHLRPDERPTATAAPVAIRRNAPCPCGSGRKYKLCCASR